ncbi:MAG: hypothetical protein RI566_08785 [Sediminimonas sp.]|uniref:hypothetical protein n=1 Tax=Sediminimonas sp. TaxID=2823379 RepID=UPI0028702893|nr:hypothetical protein [Sediminimonas sp.]MDR9485256.1 hypothetical protein [Sediminimonas sp.]
MSDLRVTATRLFEGVWEAMITTSDPTSEAPNIGVTHLDRRVEGVEVMRSADAKHWALRVPVPREAISDGVQTFVVRDLNDDAVLGSFTIIAGEALADDIRAEVNLLREELDMLKSAFRRHCLETT